MRWRVPFLIALSIGLVAGIGSATASDPPSGTATVPTTTGQTATDSWIGTIPTGSNATSSCSSLSLGQYDSHTVQVSVPAGVYGTLDAQFTFSISWTPPVVEDVADEIITVIGPDGNVVGSGDSSSTTEKVIAHNLPAGSYEVRACGFVNAAPQPYTGKLEITTANPDPSLPAASANGLAFSAAVPADPQRDESEPLITIDKNGNIYTCGPTGFSQAADYAQVSSDGGNQFHMLGNPPRGQQGAGGGGDCGNATGIDPNPAGKYQYAYTGLGPLTGFVTSSSPDEGKNLTTGGPFGNGITDTGGGADRQWNTFINDHTVLLSYNQQQPRDIVIQTSTDGGITYSPLASIAAPRPTFPGPLKYMRYTAPDGSAKDLVYFPWDKTFDGGDAINLSISKDHGATWTDCRAAVAPAQATIFATADNDRAGNIYVVYGERANFHTYMTALPVANLDKCNNPVNQNPLSPGTQPTNDPGFTPPVQVDRGAVRSTIFPWVAAGGDPGKVAVAFYGTETNGDPNSGNFKASWDVYVNQSVNALSTDPANPATFSQVKATTHPFHYDSICINGLGCDLANPPGDRSLADFFAMALDPKTGKLMVVFNRTNKKPNEPLGHVARPMVVTQIGGPSNAGGTVTGLPVVRTSSTDPTGDALSSYSLLVPSRTGAARNETAADITSVSVGPEVDFHTGQTVPNPGFTVTIKVADLSTAALQSALLGTQGQSLLWVFDFVNGHTSSAASARWNPVQGFTFGFNDYSTGSSPCEGSGTGDKCVLYPGDVPIQGAVDQTAGTIRLSVPRNLLRQLSGGTGDGQRPSESAAQPGARFYDATAFTFANTLSPVQAVQSWLYTLDNAPAMDFVLGNASGTSAPCDVRGGGSILGTGTEAKFTVDAHKSGKGDVAYRDPGANVDFRAKGTLTVTCTGSKATITGSGLNNNETTPKSFRVDVVDNGESGTTDTFSFKSPSDGSGYSKSGTLIRGNIQVR